jgi:hypothetical protein
MKPTNETMRARQMARPDQDLVSVFIDNLLSPFDKAIPVPTGVQRAGGSNRLIKKRLEKRSGPLKKMGINPG